MTIHHSTKKKAEKLGIMLSECEANEPSSVFPDVTFPEPTVQAFWSKFNVYAFGAGDKPAQAALAEMEAIVAIKDRFVESVIINYDADPFLIRVFDSPARNLTLDVEPMTPSDALLLAKNDKHVWKPTTVPEDGGEAHKLGFPITDNPHDEGSEEYDAWDEQWEASADEADAEANDTPGGSVVKPEYRARYAEAGHPTHCGDWLAETLNNLVQGKTATDLERFEDICAENDVDTTKYKRSGTGWQGRLRMTGRNLLAKKVYLNSGVLRLPDGMFPDVGNELKAPAEWMTKQRFKSSKNTKPTEEKADA